MWNPSSYIAEIVGSQTSSQRVTELSSIEIKNILQNEHRNCVKRTTQIGCTAYSIFFSTQNDTTALDELVNEEHSYSDDEFVSIITDQTSIIFSKYFNRNDVVASRILVEAFSIYCVTEKILSFEERHIIALSTACWNIVFDVQQPWKVGVVGSISSDGEPEYISISTLDKNSNFLFSDKYYTTDGDIDIFFSLSGSDFFALCAIGIEICTSHLPSKDLLLFLQSLKEKKFVADFIVSVGGLLCKSTETMTEFKSTQVWNHSSNCLKVVKNGNSADGFHHLQSCSHNEKLFLETTTLARQFPRLYAGICTPSQDGLSFVQQLQSVLLFSTETGDNYLVFSIEQCNPAHNHITCENSRFSLLLFEEDALSRYFGSESCRWDDNNETVAMTTNDAVRIPRLAASSNSFEVVSTLSSFQVGDCSVIAAKVSCDNKNRLLFCHGSTTLQVNPCEQHLFFPVLCVTKHSLFGTTGTMCNGCVLSSHFPPTLTTLIPLENMHFTENEVDGNLSFFFFVDNTLLFQGRSFRQCIDELPFSISPLDAEKRGHFGCEVRGRLIRMETVKDHVLLTVSVTNISESTELLCCVL